MPATTASNQAIREMWTIVDARTGERGTIVTYPSAESVERAIAGVRRNVGRGSRPDLVGIVEHLVPRRLPHAGFNPGDVVPET